MPLTVSRRQASEAAVMTSSAFAPICREPDERRTVMARIQLVACEAVGDEQIGDALNVLPRNAKSSRRSGDGPVSVGKHAQNLPPRLRLADSGGEDIAMGAQGSRRLENVRDQQREMVSPNGA